MAQCKEDSSTCKLLLDVKGQMERCECVLMRRLIVGAVCNEVDQLMEHVAPCGPIILNLNCVVAPIHGSVRVNQMHFRFPGNMEPAKHLVSGLRELGKLAGNPLHGAGGTFWAVRESLQGAGGNSAAEPGNNGTLRIHPRRSQ